MPNIVLTKTYQNGSTPTKEQHDALFDSLESIVNVTGFDAMNFQDNSLTTASIADNGITTGSIASNAVTSAKLAPAVTTRLWPAGIVMAFAASAAPTGWLHCDGSAVSRATYATLFSAVSTYHGAGDGTTTFNLPDYRGRFLRGRDNSAGNDPDRASRTAMAASGATGDNVGTLQTSQFASHTHSMYTTVFGYDAAGTAVAGSYTASSATLSATASTTGGTETRPKNINVMWIIKT